VTITPHAGQRGGSAKSTIARNGVVTRGASAGINASCSVEIRAAQAAA